MFSFISFIIFLSKTYQADPCLTVDSYHMSV